MFSLGSGRKLQNLLEEKKCMAAPSQDRIEALEVFSLDIQCHYDLNLQDEETFRQKMAIRRRLCQELNRNPVFKGCSLLAVGSTVNGLGSYNSDLDMCLLVKHPKFGWKTDRQFALKHLNEARWTLRHSELFIESSELIPAKVPILRLHSSSPDSRELEIEMNVNSTSGLFNSHLLYYYSMEDKRFPALALFLKHWAIRADVMDSINGTLNSYSLVLLVVHFLQCVPSPPVLPNLQKLYPERFAGERDVRLLSLGEGLPDPPTDRRENGEALGELICSFFDYYANRLSFRKKGISIRNAGLIDRRTLPPDTQNYLIFIEDPYEAKNTASCVTQEDNWKRIRKAFKDADRKLKIKPSAAYLGVKF